MAGITSDAQLYEEVFKVDSLSEPKYDRVDRLFCTSLDGQTKMELDINNELFPCAEGDELTVALATSLALDGSKEEAQGWRDTHKAGEAEHSLADMFDYVCHGKTYKIMDAPAKKDGEKTEWDRMKGDTLIVLTSFGGLLMMLEGPPKKLIPLQTEDVWFLCRK